MSDAKPGQEPSMEEILASIRQIISDDVGVERGVASGDDGDVLELTEMMNDDGSVTAVGNPASAAPPAKAEAAVSATGDLRPSVKAPLGKPSEDAAVRKAEAFAKEVSAAADDMVSIAAAGDVASALGSLSSAVSGSRHVQLGGGDKTLEALVKEMLRPMLKDWLDENLPPLVERLVEREIQRISGRADNG